jgi:hypothetical protein
VVARSGGEGLDGGLGLLLNCVVDGLGAGEDVESEVAAAFGPFVVLFGQDGADESDDAGPVGEDPDDAGARRISRLSRSLGLLDQI